MKTRLRDERLFSRPSVFAARDYLIVKDNVLSPKRLSYVQYLLLEPLKNCWTFMFILLVIERLIFFSSGMSPLQGSLPLGETYGFMGILCAAWLIEQASRYATTSFFFGKSVKVIVTPDDVIVGQWPFRKRFSRELNLNIIIEEFNGLKDEVAYRHAHKIFLTCDNARMHLIAEMADSVLASRFHMNLKTVFEAHLHNDYDLDPTLKANAQLHTRTSR